MLTILSLLLPVSCGIARCKPLIGRTIRFAWSRLVQSWRRALCCRITISFLEFSLNFTCLLVERNELFPLELWYECQVHHVKDDPWGNSKKTFSLGHRWEANEVIYPCKRKIKWRNILQGLEVLHVHYPPVCAWSGGLQIHTIPYRILNSLLLGNGLSFTSAWVELLACLAIWAKCVHSPTSISDASGTAVENEERVSHGVLVLRPFLT